MKRALFIVFSVFVSFCYGQLSLSRYEAYNYAIGDQFIVTTYSTCFSCQPYSNASGSWDVRTTVLTKTLSVTSDTVGYDCLVEKNYMYWHWVPSGATYAWQQDTTFSQQVLTYTYTALSSPVALDNYLYSNCYTDSVDTTFYNPVFCNQKEWHKYYTAFSTTNCFEQSNPDCYYVEGCGGPYYSRILDFSSGGTFHTDLIYFKKGNITCGRYVIMGVEELARDIHVSIYPNPATEWVYVKSDRKIDYVQVFSAFGNQVLHSASETGSGIDISGLARGLYYIRITDVQGFSSVHKLVVER